MDEAAEMLAYFRVERLFAEYCACLDDDRLEDWPELFVEDGCYRMVSRENHAQGLPIPLVQFDSRGMMRDRVRSLRDANIYEAHRYRHALSGMRIVGRDDDEWRVDSSFLVVQTRGLEFTEVYLAGSCHDRLVDTPQGLRFRERLVVYDTARIRTLLATPV